MRYPLARQIAVFLLLSTTVLGAEPLAVITSAESFEISGVSVPVTGVPSWPLVEGDEVVTKGSGAILMFDNQTKVVLDKNSVVELKRRDRKTTVQLLKGALKYSLPVGSLLQILARGRELDLSSNRGSVSVADPGVFVTPLGSDADVVFASTAQSSQFLLTQPARSPADCRNLTPGNQGGRSQCAPE